MSHRSGAGEWMAGRPIGRLELETALADLPGQPAQGGSASAAPIPALIVASQSSNRYTVRLATVGASNQPPQPIDGPSIEAVNLAEPFDQPGQLEADTAVLVWPSQGLYLFSHAVPQDEPGSEPPADQAGWWARVVSGGGPIYTVRRQIASGPAGLIDAPGAEDVSAGNVWELSVDGQATADVPGGAIVRVWEEPDSSGLPQRFFFYPIHAVYR